MYVGRIVAAGMNSEGRTAAMYRVSSRSFPNRRAVLNEGMVSIIPKEGFESDIYRNPYIAYNCLRLVNGFAVVTNGSHTDPLAEKITAGTPIRDAMANTLLAMDYEKDMYNTPRIAAVVRAKERSAVIGIVRRDALLVREFELKPGTVYYVATYEHNAPDEQFQDAEFTADSADDCCEHILGKGVFADLERPVSAACAMQGADGSFQRAIQDAPQSA